MEQQAASLPEELVRAIVLAVPKRSRVLCRSEDGRPAISLTTRGGAEGVSRLWRAVALSLPCEAVFSCALLSHPAEELQAALPHLRIRALHGLEISSWSSTFLPAAVPGMLAWPLFPRLRRLELRGDLLLRFSSFLPMCTALEELRIACDPDQEDMDGEMLAAHLCGLPGPLDKLTVSFLRNLARPDVFVQTLGEPALAARYQQLGLFLDWLPEPGSQLPWALPGLRHLHVGLTNAEEMGELAARLPLLAGITSLSVERWPLNVPPSLPGLELLPALRQLNCAFQLPPQAWQCPHLTSLQLFDLGECLVPAELACTRLQRLALFGCRFPRADGPGDLAFPAALCGLGQLTSLEIVKSRGPSLPPDVSRLQTLRRLAVIETPLSAADLEALSLLPSLASLHLESCGLQALPPGPYLVGLTCLNITANAFPAPLPAAVTALFRLRALGISMPPRWIGDEVLLAPALQAALTPLGQLETLFLASHDLGPAAVLSRQALIRLHPWRNLVHWLETARGVEVMSHKRMAALPEWGGTGMPMDDVEEEEEEDEAMDDDEEEEDLPGMGLFMD